MAYRVSRDCAKQSPLAHASSAGATEQVGWVRHLPPADGLCG